MPGWKDIGYSDSVIAGSTFSWQCLELLIHVQRTSAALYEHLLESGGSIPCSLGSFYIRIEMEIKIAYLNYYRKTLT